MIMLLIFSFLFFLGGIYNVYTMEFADVIADAVIAVILLGIYIFFRREKKENNKFLQWIDENQERINSSGLEIGNGQVIDRYTELTMYYACISFIIFTVKLPSRYYIKGTVSSNIAKIVYTLITFLLGWWGLPWGPIYTVQIIYKNISGNYNVEVNRLMGQAYEV